MQSMKGGEGEVTWTQAQSYMHSAAYRSCSCGCRTQPTCDNPAGK